MIPLKISGLGKIYIIRAFINALIKHYPELEVEYSKHRWHRTLEIEIKGMDEEAFASDLQGFCAEVGWKMERR
jgi:hypothetical protein